MTRKLSLSNETTKFLDHLDAKQFRQVVRKLFALMEDAMPTDSIMMEGGDYRRADQGEYRIVYSFDSDTVKVLVVGSATMTKYTRRPNENNSRHASI